MFRFRFKSEIGTIYFALFRIEQNFESILFGFTHTNSQLRQLFFSVMSMRVSAYVSAYLRVYLCENMYVRMCVNMFVYVCACAYARVCNCVYNNGYRFKKQKL